MKKYLKIVGLIILAPVIVLVGRFVYLQITSVDALKTYENNFISFQYPANLIIDKENVWETHDALPSGKDPYGMTTLSFKHPRGDVLLTFTTFNQLHTKTNKTIKERIIEKETHLKEAYPDSLKSINTSTNGSATSIVAVYDDNDFPYLGEIISAVYITPLYTHDMEARWWSGVPLFDWYGRKIVAHNLVDAFVSSFREK